METTLRGAALVDMSNSGFPLKPAQSGRYLSGEKIVSTYYTLQQLAYNDYFEKNKEKVWQPVELERDKFKAETEEEILLYFEDKKDEFDPGELRALKIVEDIDQIDINE